LDVGLEKTYSSSLFGGVDADDDGDDGKLSNVLFARRKTTRMKTRNQKFHLMNHSCLAFPPLQWPNWFDGRPEALHQLAHPRMQMGLNPMYLDVLFRKV
jgi:hypothetical protein